MKNGKLEERQIMHDPRTNAETKNILKLIAEAGYDVSDEGEKRAGMKAQGIQSKYFFH